MRCYDSSMNSLRLTACTLATIFLSSCSLFTQQKVEEQSATPQKETVAAATADKKAPVTTVAEPTKLIPVEEVVQLPQEQVEPIQAGYEIQTSNVSPIPGRSGLRLGKFAPPEEAASTTENAAPTPNAAERRGLRSPSLPTTLPLDVNGQSKQN